MNEAAAAKGEDGEEGDDFRLRQQLRAFFREATQVHATQEVEGGTCVCWAGVMGMSRELATAKLRGGPQWQKGDFAEKNAKRTLVVAGGNSGGTGSR